MENVVGTKVTIVTLILVGLVMAIAIQAHALQEHYAGLVILKSSILS